MIIIGITGTLGAGKGTIVERLKNAGFRHFSVREFIKQEAIKRELPLNRDTFVAVANDLRVKHGPGYIAEELYKQAATSGGNCIIESLRTVGEIRVLKSKSKFCLFAVDADPKLRYERNVLRGSETDRISFEKFLEDEKHEMSSNDQNKQNLEACIKLADYKFVNNGTIASFNEQVDSVINKVLDKSLSN